METINTHLEQALSFANYQTTLNQQRRLLKQKFENDCIVAHNGGLFKISQEWLAGFDAESLWCLDMNQNPVQIENSTEFFEKAQLAYRTALSEYGTAYQELRKQRSVRVLTGI
jgi:hypothetical protein